MNVVESVILYFTQQQQRVLKIIFITITLFWFANI
jgi:hypothetical protein